MPTTSAAALDRTWLGRVGRWLTQYIFGTLLKSEAIKIASDTERTSPGSGDELIELRLPNFYRSIRILLKPDIMLGQSYVDGHWSVQPEKLFDFLYLIRSQDSSKLQKWFLLSGSIHLLRDAFKQRLFPIRSTRAVVEHYNTDPAFMSLMLGPSLSYTCAFFEGNGTSLEDAQMRKLELIANRISILPGQSVLDMGTGWGYAPFPLAEKYGCEVTGITISEAQVAYCNERKKMSAARQKLQFVRTDYANYKPSARFDRVISVGMLEHVGKYQYKFFFDKVSEFLRDDGIALIHCMVEERETTTDAWIDKNIFPGGYIPTISEVVSGIERSNCQLISLFIHEKSNYFRTLDFWKRNLFRNRARCEGRLKELGLKDEEVRSIIRIWEYFFSSSQIGFSDKYGVLRVVQFVVRRTKL